MNSLVSSCDLDPIPTCLIKEFVNDFVPYITQIVNKSLKCGFFPDCLQHALIKPLLKKPSLDRQDLKNYRPIANLKYLGKVIERVVSGRLQSHLKNNSLQNPFQSAYREMHSVESALLRVNNDVLIGMDNGNVSGLVLLDLSSAFDTVDHCILLNRLKEIGLNGIVLKWFMSYLSSRSQEVCIRDATSASVSLDFSVPQGSVLGPQLFNVYTLPIQHIVQKHSINYHMYADDLQLYFICKPVQKEIDENVKKIENCIADVKELDGWI